MTEREFYTYVYSLWEKFEATGIDPEWRIDILSRLLAAEMAAGIRPDSHKEFLEAFLVSVLTLTGSALHPQKGDTIN